jgi:hypothetical protein
MSHRTYITIKTTQVDAVNYDEVNENKDTLRYSLDGSEFVVKWEEDGEEDQVPDSIVAIPTEDKSAVKTHAEILVIMNSPEWSEIPE